MRFLTVARNIVNTDEVDAQLAEFKERYDTISTWIDSVLRNWILRKAPATQSTEAVDQTGMPEWLRRSMEQGEQPKLFVVDMNAVRERAQPVLDYMENLIAEKPGTDIQKIGFDVAEARTKKWHDQMRKEAERRAKQGQPAAAIEEPGTAIIKQYPDGYTWRSVTSKQALTREGDVMGHCVGRFGYFNQVIRDRVTIVSLRDEKNEPHVTIELNGKDVVQIKGKQNREVLPKYMPYVEDYLKSQTWNSINFDKAPTLQQQVEEHHRQTAPDLFSWGRLRLIRGIRDNYYGKEYQILDDNRRVIADLSMDSRGDHAMTLFKFIQKEPYPTLPEFVARMIMELAVHSGKLEALKAVTQLLAPGVEWSNQRQFGQQLKWVTPATVSAHAVAMLTTGAEVKMLLYSGESVIGYNENNWFVFSEMAFQYLKTDRVVEIVLASGVDDIDAIYTAEWYKPDELTPQTNTLSVVKKLASGKKVKMDNDKVLMNSLLDALKQPNTVKLKQAAMSLSRIDDPRDADFKQHGIPTGGRSISAVAMLLASSLTKNMLPFQQYVFSKPNALTCFAEVLTQPDHVKAALESYGLDQEQIIAVVLLLRNEFLRLMPTADQVDQMEVSSSVKAKLRAILGKLRGQKNNRQQSKEIWS